VGHPAKRQDLRVADLQGEAKKNLSRRWKLLAQPAHHFQEEDLLIVHPPVVVSQTLAMRRLEP
jgi:hypothetical protein